jgi:oligoendopeptidase F
MLNQLEQLSLASEGRYATAQELQILKDYFPSINPRLSAYQKLRDGEGEIIARLETRMREKQPNIFQMSDKDVAAMYQRDTKIVLRIAIAAMLIEDLDRLREKLLLWQKTIVKAFKVNHIAALTHTTMPEIVQQFLTPEEYAVIKPILILNQTVLGN